MGKKGKDKKKGKGAEKTAMKTDKKGQARQKKLLAKIGETDIEQMVADCEKQVANRKEITEIVCAAPSPRVSFAICAHPDKEEIILHGGEFNNGQTTQVFNDFLFYNVPKNEWRAVTSPGGPTPRCAHQMVSVASDGGQIWMFGGEYGSPSQLQFYHYRDLWVFRLSTRVWEKINAPNGPSSRSGHRMVAAKKRLIVFGGFHDNNSSYRYFNDLFMFSLETYTWQKVECAGLVCPSPRSACCMAATSDGKILVWGGYSKAAVKKEIDRGVTHQDMFSLAQDKSDVWKWTAVKAGGIRPAPRSGVATAVAANGKVYCFGGVLDTEEDEEDVRGQFSSDLHAMEMASQVWRLVEVTGKKDKKKCHKENIESMQEDKKASTTSKDTVVSTDGVFTMSVGGPSQITDSALAGKSNVKPEIEGPSARMKAGTVVCKGKLYLFGGNYEEGSKLYTMNDLYSLDLHKLDSWRTIISNDQTKMEWLGSDSEDDDDDDDDDEDDDDEDDDDDENEDDSDSESEMDTD